MMFVQGLLLIVVLNVQIAAAFAPVGSARITVVGAVQNKFRAATTTAKPVLWPLFYRNSKNETSIGIVTNDHSPPIHRFERTASQARQIDEPCILTIDNIRYNVTAWGTYTRCVVVV